MSLNIAKVNPETNDVALLTPTYARDVELCALLCESVDRHVGSFSKHYLLVPDGDVALFSRFESERRCVLPVSKLLPGWLRPLPPMVRRKRRQYWWSFRAMPVSGWHVQQILKIAATIALPHQRYCILDSDIVFFRNFDLSRFEYPKPIPLLGIPDKVTSRPDSALALGRDQPSTPWASSTNPSGSRLHRSHHILGPAGHPSHGFQNRNRLQS